MKILLFGGTFDPPHYGHVNNLKAAIALVQPDRVIVMPAGTPPHKAASATPGPVRMDMCRCFRPYFPGLEISDWEIKRGGKSYTVDTLTMLAEENPGAQLFLAMGSDMLLTFTQWRRWRDILLLCTLVVASRKQGDGGALAAAAHGLRAVGGRVLFAPVEAVPMASSDVRSGRLGVEALPSPVPFLIRKYHLYTHQPPSPEQADG